MDEIISGNFSDIKMFKNALEEKIKNCEKVIIIPHNNIDFDAIGSAIGLSLIAKKYKKDFYILINDSTMLMDHGARQIYDLAKSNYNIINKDKYLKNMNENDLFLLTDVNKSSLISISDCISNKSNVAIIDHHFPDSNTISSDCTFINSNISSASEIVTNLLDMYKIKIPSDVANYLLAGIRLDTATFQRNVSRSTHLMVANLMDYGATCEKVDEWFVEEINSDKRVHNLIGLVQLYTYKLAIVSAEDDTEYTKEELAKAADYLLKYGVDASFVIGNIGNNTISISGRSMNKVNVGEVMSLFNGGGNSFSGAAKITDGNIRDISEELVESIEPKHYVKRID